MSTPSHNTVFSSRPTTTAVFVFLLVAILAAFAPYALVRQEAGEEWRGVTLQLSGDALRYYARANDVTRGNFHAHNPYFIEHNHEPSPTPSINDALLALPSIAGSSFNAAYYINIALWSFAYLMLCFLLLRALGLSLVLSIVGTIWCFVGQFYDATRPGAMSIVFPIFLVFLLFFYRFVSGDKKAAVPLGIAAGIGIHSYIYLFMSAFSILGVYGLYALAARKWEEAKGAIVAGMTGALVTIPHFIAISNLSQYEFYHRALERIVFLYTHWPQIELYYYGRWVVLGMLIVYLSRRFFPDRIKSAHAVFFLCVGGGILLAMSSNIITGRDFNIPTSVGRFGIMWYLLLGVVFVAPIIRIVREEWRQTLKVLTIAALFALLVLQMFLNLPRSVGIHLSFDRQREAIIEVQRYRGAIEWLSREPQAVVAAPEKMMMYIPTLTKQFVLYASHGALFMMSDRELRERLMLHLAFEGITEEEFVSYYAELESNRVTMLAFASRERHRFCTFFYNDEKCEPPQKAEDFADLDAYRREYRAYYPDLRANILREYAKYHVRYVVVSAEAEVPGELREWCTPAYEDEEYKICIMKYPTGVSSM